MKIQKIEIKNFKSIDYKSIDLQGKSIFVLGPNASGKTSFIDACFLNLPGEPLKKGTNKGEIELTVDNYIINYQFTAKNQVPKLNIFDQSGQPQKAPATLLKELFGVKDFEIEKFLSLPMSKKVETLKKMIGIDFSDLDDEYKKSFDERTFVNRQLKEFEAKTASETFVLKFGTEKVDLQPIYDKIEKATEQNSKIDHVEKGLVELKKQLEEIQKKISDGEKWLEGKSKIDIESIKNDLQEKIQHNNQVENNIRIAKDREQLAELAEKSESLTRTLEEIKLVKKRQLEENPIPVKGLSFDDDTLLLDGLPFESDQINTARKIIAGLELQYQLIGDVKIARFDGSLLDNNSIETVVNWAKEKDIQLFVEFVDRDADGIKYEINENI